ncbi:Alpha/Beta hydrolase protein [Hyaloscypha sp. PMI_1271]|nr:Alpha/Beta hydrolase protein [Hyaloscypha sp. PMI_1271]
MPQCSRSGFHFSSESYGGHYGPILNEYIEAQNATKITGAHHITLETVLIGNGRYGPPLQYQAYHNYSVFLGNIHDYTPLNASVQAQFYNNRYGAGNCVDRIKNCAARGISEICMSASSFCANLVESVHDNCSWRYLNTPNVQAAIRTHQSYCESSNAVSEAFTAVGDDNREVGTNEALKKSIKHNVTVMLFAGDAGYNCNWLGGQVVAYEAEAPEFDCAGFVNISTTDNIAHGQVKQAGKISFVRIYGSGHEVPFYQPPAALSIFERAMNGKDVATGALTASMACLTEGAKDSTYRKGNSTIQLLFYRLMRRTAIRQVLGIRHIGRRSWSEEGAGAS